MGTNVSTSFFESNKDFPLNLQLRGVKGSPAHEVCLHELTELSYEALCQKAIDLTVSLQKNKESLSFCRTDYDVELKYKDNFGNWIRMATTEDLIESITKLLGQGFMCIMADVKPKTQQSVASLPPLVASSTQSVPSMPKKRKEAPMSMKSSVAAVTPDRGNGGPLRVTSMAHVAIKQEPKEDFTKPKKKLSRTGAKILQGLVELHALGIKDPLREHVALTAGYKNVKKSIKGFNNQLAPLKRECLIEYRGSTGMTLTQEGLNSLPAVAPPQNNPEAQMRLRALFNIKKGSKLGQIFDKLCDGKIYDRVTLQIAVGHTNLKPKSFDNELSKLGGLKLIHRPSKTTVQLADIAFPFPRRRQVNEAPTQSALAPSTPKKRKEAPTQEKSSVPAVTAVRVDAGPSPPQVASMANVAIKQEEEDYLTQELEEPMKKRSSVAAVMPYRGNGGSMAHVAIKPEVTSIAHVAIKQEEEDYSTEAEEPKKKRARTGETLLGDKILQRLVELHALGIKDPLRKHVALMVGYGSIKTTAFSSQLTKLKRDGFIEYPDGKRMVLAQEGLNKLPAVATPQNRDEAQMRLRTLLNIKKFKEGTKIDQIFEKLCDGQIHDRETLAMSVGNTSVKSSGFANALSKLSGLKLIHYPSSTTVQLADIAVRPSVHPQVYNVEV